MQWFHNSGLQVEVTQIILHEADQPDIFVNFLDADSLSGEDLAEVDFLVAQTNRAAAGNHDGFVVEGIIDIGQAGVRARRRLVDFRGTLHIQSFMRTLLVEDQHELVEAGLLLQEVGGGRLSGFFFQGEMHAFVASILLRMASFDPFDTNAEAQPPDGKFAEVEQSMWRCKRDAVRVRFQKQRCCSAISGEWDREQTSTDSKLGRTSVVVVKIGLDSFNDQQLSRGPDLHTFKQWCGAIRITTLFSALSQMTDCKLGAWCVRTARRQFGMMRVAAGIFHDSRA